MIMENYTFTVETTIIGTEDGQNTYEVRKKLDTGGKAAVLIALYPTVSMLAPTVTDNSTQFLMNHVYEFGYNDIHICNLYSSVHRGRPSTKQLHRSEENLSHIGDLLDELDKKKTDVLCCWGSTLTTNANTNQIKVELLQMLKDKGWEKQVKHIVTDTLETEKQLATHILWLGLHHNNETWMTATYPIEAVLRSMGVVEEKEVKQGKEPKEQPKKKNSRKTHHSPQGEQSPNR
jgi:hypothetical protein